MQKFEAKGKTYPLELNMLAMSIYEDISGHSWQDGDATSISDATLTLWAAMCGANPELLERTLVDDDPEMSLVKLRMSLKLSDYGRLMETVSSLWEEANEGMPPPLPDDEEKDPSPEKGKQTSPRSRRSQSSSAGSRKRNSGN